MASTDRPNILIIMADQLTAALTGAYGHRVVQTPGIDKLAAEGVRFDAAYTNCPLCAPARAAMLTGRQTSRTRTYDNGSALADDVPTFAHYLRLAGYQTAVSGKLHLIGADQLHGFDRRLTTDIYPADFSWVSDWSSEPLHSKSQWLPDAGPCRSSVPMNYDEEVHFRALEYLRQREQASDNRPFCLFVSYTHPHPPYDALQEYWNLYEDAEIELPAIPDDMDAHRSQMDRWAFEFEGVPPEMMQNEDLLYRVRRAYYAMVSYLDAKVGELLAAVDALGLREDTAVFFTADHGDLLGEREMVEKLVFYEWSARVPLIGRFPGRWQAGGTCNEPVGLIDLLPTLTDLARAPQPFDIDGVSFLGLLEGQPDGGRTVFGESHGEGVRAPCFMVRRGRYKYIYIHGFDCQLFDVEADPGEWNNLAGRHAVAVQQDLHRRLLERFDPQAIAEDVRHLQKQNAIIRDAMKKGRPTSWDFQPFFDASSRYVR